MKTNCLTSLTWPQRLSFYLPPSLTTPQERCDSFIPPQNSRSPQIALDFIQGFHQELKLPETALNEKYQLMAENPLQFYRCLSALFYLDLNNFFHSQSRLLSQVSPELLIYADLHYKNLGTYQGPGGQVVWGANDFDQSEISRLEWDLERSAISLLLLVRDHLFSEQHETKVIQQFLTTYLNEYKKLKQDSVDDTVAFLTSTEASPSTQKLIEKAKERTQKELIKKYARQDTNGQYHFQHSEKLKPVTKEKYQEILNALSEHISNGHMLPNLATPLEVIDIAEKFKSGGSTYGLKRYYILAKSNTSDIPVLLQLKQLLPTFTKQQDGDLSRADANKIVTNTKTLVGFRNPFVNGVQLSDPGTYLVLEKEAQDEEYDFESFQDWQMIEDLAKDIGKILARSHYRTLSDKSALEKWINGKENLLQERLLQFSQLYANQVEKDYLAFVRFLNQKN